jgi:hypothetical protein
MRFPGAESGSRKILADLPTLRRAQKARRRTGDRAKQRHPVPSGGLYSAA